MKTQQKLNKILAPLLAAALLVLPGIPGRRLQSRFFQLAALEKSAHITIFMRIIPA
ncbi:hypothetical protein [Paenibacillus sp. IHB B 3415]|uniref:hypothetical protein n=1 Tax=Paenibacillus sp. IHB B 3415 TaxID=867080 RepID=UPI000ADBA55B|nr:hypothetical protein [Paenibacillus sp. IHB B 3415]